MKKYALLAAAGIALGTGLSTQVVAPALAQESQSNVYDQLDLFGSIFDRVRNQYVEEVEPDELIEAAINGMLTSLDPHSSYLSAEAAEEMRTNTRGEFGGLGIEVTQEDGFVKVVAPHDGTPAAEAGMQTGDFITHVDGESLLGLTLTDAVNLMRGPVGAPITITVVREGVSEPFDVALVRDTITLTAVRARTESKAVVLRISTFSDKTYPELREGLETQIAAAGGIENVSGVVLDLRNNPGGLLDQAILVSDAFLTEGEIVSTRGRNAQDSSRWNAKPDDLAQGKPIVVLINGGSASASEIVAGALQDHDRAVVIGTKSFGKGSVQTLVPLSQQGAMRLTTARYYTPSGRSIQSLGISPDIVVDQRLAVEEGDEDSPASAVPDRSERTLRGALRNDSLTEDEIRQIELERERAEQSAALRDEDYQLAYAIDLLTGLAVLEGK